MRTLLLAVVLALFTQGGDPNIAAKYAIGEVKSIDATAKQITIKTDAGSTVAVSVSDKTSYKKLAPGEQSLTNATDVTFADWKMLPVDIDAVIIMYTATLKGTYKGKDVPPGPYHEASAYVNRNGEWLAIYYQETPSEKMPPAPTAKKTPASSPAAPAKPAETGPDPIANEKIVWDCFKTKNWDGFASLLAPDFKEVEADGVFDKTGSVKALQEMAGDMSMFELSDWKALSFDDDAKLVTYTVTAKGPKPMKDYHSTIWVKRDGKWLGLYHQGTPEMTAPAAKPEK